MDSFLEEGYDYDDNDHNEHNDYGDEDHDDPLKPNQLECVSDFSAWLPFWRKVWISGTSTFFLTLQAWLHKEILTELITWLVVSNDL